MDGKLRTELGTQKEEQLEKGMVQFKRQFNMLLRKSEEGYSVWSKSKSFRIITYYFFTRVELTQLR